MEPTLPSPYGSPEVGPVLPKAPEVVLPHVPEQGVSHERPALQEQRTGSGAGDTPPPLPYVPLPATQPSTTSTQAAQPIKDDPGPAVAADEDLIEKEWVEKAKKVISDTKHDPYAQEQAVSRLQADYLHKRYGKVIKVPQEE